MSKEENAAALKTFAEAAGKGKYELFDKVVAPNCVDHDPGPGQVAGPAGYKALFQQMHAAFPDMTVGMETMVADEDSIAFAYTFKGTQTGPLMGIAPTGKSVSFRGLQISKFKDGMMVERWGSSDQLGMLQQLGVTELPKA